MSFSQGQLGFLVVLQLVLINTMNSLNTSIGLITDFTALGLFIAVGIAMVFAAISEYALLLFMKPLLEERKAKRQKEGVWKEGKERYHRRTTSEDTVFNFIQNLFQNLLWPPPG